MADIKVEIYCMSCGHEEVFEDHKRPFECPKCGSPLLHETCIIECEDCGKDVYLTDNTNECECGALYNGLGSGYPILKNGMKKIATERLVQKIIWTKTTGQPDYI